MKKFIAGVLVGIMLVSTGFAASYVAETPTFKVFVNGKEFNSNPPVLVVNGSTYLPLKAMGDALNVPVKWNADARQVEVGTPPLAASTTSLSKTNDKWKLTYLGTKECTELSQFTKASEGKKFLVANFELENITSEAQNFNIFYLKSYIDGYQANSLITGENIDGAVMLGGNKVEPGKKVKCYLLYEIEGDWKELDVVYNESLTGDTTNKLELIINK